MRCNASCWLQAALVLPGCSAGFLCLHKLLSSPSVRDVTAFGSCCHCQESERERASQRVPGTAVRVTGKHVKLSAGFSGDFLQLGCARQGVARTKKTAPPAALQPAGELTCHNLGIFHLKPLVKRKSTLPAPTPDCEGFRCQRVKGFLKMG